MKPASAIQAEIAVDGSQSVTVAYRRTLGGPDGCRNQALQGIENHLIDPRQALSSALESEYLDLLTRVSEDPRQIALASQWRECMRSKGHRWENQSEIKAMLVERIASLRAFIAGSVDVLDLVSQVDEIDIGAMTPTERTGLLNSLGAVAQARQIPGIVSRFDEIRELELSLALDDYVCTQGHLEIQLEIQFEAEERFVEDYGRRIELLMLEIGSN